MIFDAPAYFKSGIQRAHRRGRIHEAEPKKDEIEHARIFKDRVAQHPQA